MTNDKRTAADTPKADHEADIVSAVAYAKLVVSADQRGEFDASRTAQVSRALLERDRQWRELIMAVAKKFPDETRHQTALRYIQERERSSNESGCKAALGDDHEQ